MFKIFLADNAARTAFDCLLSCFWYRRTAIFTMTEAGGGFRRRLMLCQGCCEKDGFAFGCAVGKISHFSDGLSCTMSASRKFVFPVFGSIRHSGRRGLKVVRESRHSDARGVRERAAARKRRGGDFRYGNGFNRGRGHGCRVARC